MDPYILYKRRVFRYCVGFWVSDHGGTTRNTTRNMWSRSHSRLVVMGTSKDSFQRTNTMTMSRNSTHRSKTMSMVVHPMGVTRQIIHC